MKILIFFPLAILTYFGSGKSKNDPKTYYYFCVSHSMPINDGTAKEFILITDVKKITCDERDLKIRSKSWKNVVDNHCKNSSGCTSDFNYYRDQASADTQLVNTKKRFSDTARYMLSKVDFK